MIQQLTLFSVRDYIPNETQFGTVVKNDSLSTHYQGFELDSESSGVINTYSPGGTSRTNKKYYRYSYRDKNRMIHKHIPGGNIDSTCAKKRAALVQVEIDSLRSPDQIVEYIKTFGRTTRKSYDRVFVV